MLYIDYYKVLGVERTASSEAIRKAYISLAWKYHPDRNRNNEKALVKFTLINEAYRVLGNLENRLKFKIKLEQFEKIKELAKNKHKRIMKDKNSVEYEETL